MQPGIESDALDFKVGASSVSAFSTASVAVKVLAPYWLASDIMTPGLPMTKASPNLIDAVASAEGLLAHAESATRRR